MNMHTTRKDPASLPAQAGQNLCRIPTFPDPQLKRRSVLLATAAALTAGAMGATLAVDLIPPPAPDPVFGVIAEFRRAADHNWSCHGVPDDVMNAAVDEHARACVRLLTVVPTTLEGMRALGEAIWQMSEDELQHDNGHLSLWCPGLSDGTMGDDGSTAALRAIVTAARALLPEPQVKGRAV